MSFAHNQARAIITFLDMNELLQRHPLCCCDTSCITGQNLDLRDPTVPYTGLVVTLDLGLGALMSVNLTRT